MAALFEYLTDVYFFVKDCRGRFVHANRAFVEKCGARELSEVRGRTDFDFFPPDLAHSFVRDDRRVLESGVALVNKVELVPNQDGTLNWHVTSKIPLYYANESIAGLAGTTRDLNKSSIALQPYKQMSEIIHHIDRACAEPIHVPDLAAMAGLSVSQFERTFKRIFQMTPRRYVTKVRIHKACQALLRTSQTVTEIAAANGFFDHSHFTREFTARIGMPPSEYRRKHWIPNCTGS